MAPCDAKARIRELEAQNLQLQFMLTQVNADAQENCLSVLKLKAEVARLRTALQGLSLYVACNGDDWVQTEARKALGGAQHDRDIQQAISDIDSASSTVDRENARDSADEPYNATLAKQWTEASAKASRLELELAAARVQIEELQSHIGINRPQYPDQHPGRTYASE